jgi:heme/copper-type cytochrome/quinol oxidase subunit 3
MWLFVVSDALTFSTLLVCYTYLRLGNPGWPTPFGWPSIVQASLMTLVLLTSSLTMALGVKAMKDGSRAGAVRMILATALCGVAFIALHASEWMHLIRVEKLTISSSLFGATFFTLTGLHMAHVAIGVIYLSVVALRVNGGGLNADDVETSGLYWHFVDLVWMFIFPLVYLMGVAP